MTEGINAKNAEGILKLIEDDLAKVQDNVRKNGGDEAQKLEVLLQSYTALKEKLGLDSAVEKQEEVRI